MYLLFCLVVLVFHPYTASADHSGDHSGMDCEEYEVVCGSGECISVDLICNGMSECNDGSDEDNCFKETTPEMMNNVVEAARSECNGFVCKSSGRCIPLYFFCDDDEDCLDGSDERNCQRGASPTMINDINFINPIEPFSCANNEFECDDGQQCISKKLRCDKTENCYDGSDELMCPPKSDDHIEHIPEPEPSFCANNEFECYSGQQCISEQLLCDKTENCYDGSDELVCPSTPDIEYRPEPEPFFCADNEFECYSGQQCISERLVCDKTENCYDGSDELVCFITPEEHIEFTPIQGGGGDEPCYPNPCGEEFTDDVYKCDCNNTNNYFETTCIMLDCQNSGKCVTPLIRNDYCSCPKGFTGRNCEIDMCSSLQCLNNGVCEISWMTDEAFCDCPKGFSGDHCEEDACSQLNCQNNAECKISWLTSDAYCDCPDGYTGKMCEEDVCGPLRCKNNGVCRVSWWTNTLFCDCPDGFSGKHCEKDLCGPLNCGENTECKISFWTQKPQCKCKEGFFGSRCEKDLCSKFDCQNDSECKISWWTNEAYCDCERGHFGKHCEKDECDYHSCHNGGVCVMSWLNYPYCICKEGYRGDHCQKDCENSLFGCRFRN